MTYFSIESQETATNQDLTIVFTPGECQKYQYEIYRDGKLEKIETVDHNGPATIVLTGTGEYTIRASVFDFYNNKQEITSGIYRIDQDKPILSVGDTVVDLPLGHSLNVMGGVIARDNQDGDLFQKVTTNIDSLDLSKIGQHKLTYTVSDQAGNTISKSIYINVIEKNTMGIFAIQLFLALFLIGIILWLLRYGRSIRLEKRLASYSIEPIDDHSVSFVDQFFHFYQKVIKQLVRVIEKSVFLTKYSKKFDKYVILYKEYHQTGKDLVAMKFLVSFIFLITAIIAKALRYEFPNFYELSIPLIFGFFTPDLVFYMSYKLHRNKIENDLLQAIIIMNNAFKSGRSVTQAISLVAGELDGAIRDEFKKMEVELAFGLGVDVIFERFAERIKLEEVTYLTASLSILNRTGGNIIKVFDSIERSLFNKKKLKLELASLTSSSKIIVNVLFAVPILFILFISILNPSYFSPFFTSKIGWILLGFMILYYTIYIIVVRKVMKVRM